MQTVVQLVGGLPGDEAQQAEAKVTGNMPMRLGRPRFDVFRLNASSSVLGVVELTHFT